MSDSETTPPNDATGSAAQTAVGALLRENRERAGLGIADVARVLRISQKYLEALEDGRNADLPGTPYAIGFVRSYAEHLHLDGEEIVRRYKEEAEGLAGKTDLIFPKPIPDGGVPGAAVLGLGVIVAAVAYGVWYWNSSNGDVEMARVEDVPEHMAVMEEKAAPAAPVAESTPEPSPTPMAAESPDEDSAVEDAVADKVEETVEKVEHVAEQAAEPLPETTSPAIAPETAPKAVAEVAPEAFPADDGDVEEAAAVAQNESQTAGTQVEDAVESTPEPAPESAQPVAQQVEEMVSAATETPSAEVEPEPAGAMPAGETPSRDNVGPSRITVRAKSNSWIQVRDEIADRLLFTRLLREGDEYEVPNRSGLRLMTGNAGALELLVDGDAVPAIGAVGEVRRDVDLDADKLKSGSAVSH